MTGVAVLYADVLDARRRAVPVDDVGRLVKGLEPMSGAELLVLRVMLESDMSGTGSATSFAGW